jgi:hypothetical protein
MKKVGVCAPSSNSDGLNEQVLLMKMVLVGLSLTMLVSTAGSAFAQARPDSLRMTCNQARAFVAARGAVILGSGPHVYDRIVSDNRFCTWPQGVERTTVPTLDTRACFAGYVCRDRPQWYPWLEP